MIELGLCVHVCACVCMCVQSYVNNYGEIISHTWSGISFPW